MLRCKGKAIYTGMTNDLNKRMEEHFSKEKNGAKYTKSHEAEKVEAVWSCRDKSLACKLEYHIKNLTKAEKEELIKCNQLKEYLKGKIDCRRYRNVDITEKIDKKYL